MEIQLVKWGNGQGIRIPKLILQELDIRVNDTLSMEVRESVPVLTAENWGRIQNLTGENRKDGKYGDDLCTAGRYTVAGTRRTVCIGAQQSVFQPVGNVSSMPASGQCETGCFTYRDFL